MSIFILHGRVSPHGEEPGHRIYYPEDKPTDGSSQILRLARVIRDIAQLPVTMNIFSLSHLNELVKELPDPKKAAQSEEGYSPVIRLPIRDGKAVRDAKHPDREFEAHANAFVEFEIVMWKDTKGRKFPRWVLRGLVAM
jgi:hypothetical protein